jgi:hypothetical protein
MSSAASGNVSLLNLALSNQMHTANPGFAKLSIVIGSLPERSTTTCPTVAGRLFTVIGSLFQG